MTMLRPLRLALDRGGPIVTGLLGAGSVKAAGILLQVALMAALARLTGPAEFGTYSYALAVVAVLCVPVQAGLPMLIIRETARGQQAGEWSYVRGLGCWSTAFIGGAAVILGLVIAIAMQLFGSWLSRGLVQTLSWALLLVPLLAWLNTRAAALTGLQNVVLGQLPENILRPGVLLLLVTGWFFWQPETLLEADQAMALTVLAGLLSLMLTAALLGRNRPAALTHAIPRHRVAAWSAAIWPLALVGGLHLVNRHTDILMLGFFVPAEDIGIYRVAAQGAMLVALPLQIVNMVIAPHVASLYAAGQLHRLQRLVTGNVRLALAGATFLAVILALAGGSLLRLAFGAGFASGHVLLAVLGAGQLINVAAGPVGLLLNMTGHERETARGVALAAGINIPLNLILILPLGVLGAALATAIATLAWNAVLWRAVRRHLSLSSDAFPLSFEAKTV